MDGGWWQVFWIERQQRVAFRASPASTADLHRKTSDENAGEAGGNKDGQGEDVHEKRVAEEIRRGRDLLSISSQKSRIF